MFVCSFLEVFEISGGTEADEHEFPWMAHIIEGCAKGYKLIVDPFSKTLFMKVNAEDL